jgi:hypothetical protein
MATDMEILTRALAFEKRGPQAWEAAVVGASRQDINRLVTAELIVQRQRSSTVQRGIYGPALYRLTEKGKRLAGGSSEPRPVITQESILGAMSHIVGFDDIKEQIAFNIESNNHGHCLLEGPPACCKTIILDAVRSAVPDALPVFGSRTSGSGLSDAIFLKNPRIILLDEADKMHHDVFSIMLGVMESQEILETKSGKTRGIELDTTVIAACNSSKKFPYEFVSRFALHPVLPHYTRDEFIDVVLSMLTRTEECPPELAEKIAVQVFDNRLGDVRQARGVWTQMREPTEEEAIRVLNLKAKYSGSEVRPPKLAAAKLL